MTESDDWYESLKVETLCFHSLGLSHWIKSERLLLFSVQKKRKLKSFQTLVLGSSSSSQARIWLPIILGNIPQILRMNRVSTESTVAIKAGPEITSVE